MRGGRLLAALLLSPASLRAQSPVVIRVDVDSVANVIDPHDALGAGVDGHGRGTVDAIYTPANIRAMRDVGFSRLTYRLRTELGVEAWHWNPVGRWSDSAHAQGYWTSDSTSARPIMLSHGYRLPRRGNTIDQAENAGYSRLDDGDTASFWKSNPYLDHRFTGESDARHPQVVIVDLARPTDVTAIQVAWGAPYATSYRIQYWRGEPARDPDENPDGKWVTFPGGAESAGTGGLERRTLSPRPIRARFVRIVMSASSGTALPGSRDPRDSSGYAIREIWLGQLDQAGAFHDAMRHGKSRTTQTLTFASSTDPWHRATDIDLDLEQPGFDLVQQSGLAEGRGAMIPVGILFDTPENGANALRYLRARGVPVERVELGEEPDGQYATPEDVAELYRRFADALAAVDTALTLGGPSFQGLSTRVQFAWPNDTAGAPWMARFLADLQAHAALGTFRFLSFEWYPYDDICGRTAPQLAEAPERLREAL
ncbi:MAG TPA: discoidin domain-containing protein, partial [Gemmatimonadaceae bacterium]|nr:discoidin domain-containing protein [Gemmatimonadaceae bacterium]